MMVIAIQSYHRAGDEPPEYRGRTTQMLRDYKRLTAQCLVLADITQPITYMMETLILYVMAEFGRSQDAEAGVLVGFTVIVRLAMRMGYHRDSKYFPAITPFQGEMRRRLWTIIRQADLLFSSQAGLPPMVRPELANTDYPLNVYDDELYEDMKTLPPSRPMNEPTPMCYVIYKSQLIDALGEVVEEVQNLRDPSYERIMKLDHRIREIHSNIPPVYKMRSIDESLRDPSTSVVKRFTLDLLFLKSLCVLHRKFSGIGGEPTRNAYSRRTTVESAMEILRHQVTLHTESTPGGRLSDYKWFISSLTAHDFLLAGVIVCMDLYQAIEAEQSGRRASNDLIEDSKERRANMTAAIEQSFNVWDGQKEESIEAFKVVGILTALQSKIRVREAQIRRQLQGSQPGSYPSPGYAANGVSPDDGKLAPEHSAAMTLGMLSTGVGAMSPNSANMFANSTYDATQSSQAQQSAALASQYLGSTADQNNGPVSAPSPFSSLFGSGMAFSSMDLPAANFNWVCLSFLRALE